MKIHMVKEGESLYTISKKYGVPLEKIVEANPQIADPNKLNIGDKVKIPSSPVPVPEQGDVYYKHTVKQGDSLWKLSKAWGIPLKDVIEANPQLKNPNALLVGEVVNLPKKTVPGSGAAGHTATGNEPLPPANPNPAASGKTVPGSKTYTGPKEKETAPMPPVPPVQPAPVQPAPVEPVPQIIVQEPIPQPQPQPVQHSVHTEVQSLYVQVSVPPEAPTYYQHVPVPPAPEVHLPPSPCVETKPVCEPVCEPSMGYPGLTENPYHYDCPATYPFYDTLPAQTVEPAAACPPELPWSAPVQLPYSCPPYGGYSPVMPVAVEECHPPQTPGYGMTAGAYEGFCPPYGYGTPGYHPAVPFPPQAYGQSGLPQAYQPGYGYPGQAPIFGAQDQMMHGMMDYEHPHTMGQVQSAGMHIPGAGGPKPVALPWPACSCPEDYVHGASQPPMQVQGVQMQGMQVQGMQGYMPPLSPLPELPSLPQDIMAGQFDYHNREEEQAEVNTNEAVQQKEEVRTEHKEEASSTTKKAKSAAPEKKAKVSAVESNRGPAKSQTKGQKGRNFGGRAEQKKRRNPWISD